MKKVFFFDIDGTLIDCARGLVEMTNASKDAIMQLQKDHIVFIATGRTKCFIIEPIAQFPFSGFVTCNGAYIELNGQCLSKKTMSLQQKQILVDFCHQHNFDFYLEGYDNIYVNDINASTILQFASKWEMRLDTMKDQFNLNEIDIHIAMIDTKGLCDYELVENTLSKYFDVARHPNQTSFDINIKGVNKGTAIKELANILQTPLSSMYAFGDGINDIEMIETVGTGIAMKNGVEILKQKANEVCEDVLEDGIVHALKRHGFIQ